MIYRIALVLAGVCFVALAGCGAQPKPAADNAAGAIAQPATASPEALFNGACAVCHKLEKTANYHESTPWKAVVDRMIFNGAKITPENAAVIVKYLDLTYPLAPKQ